MIFGQGPWLRVEIGSREVFGKRRSQGGKSLSSSFTVSIKGARYITSFTFHITKTIEILVLIGNWSLSWEEVRWGPGVSEVQQLEAVGW